MSETLTYEKPKHFAWLDKQGVRDALASDMSNSAIAKLAGVSHQTIGNFRRQHIKPASEALTKAQRFDELVNIPAQSVDLAKTLAQHPFVLRTNDLWEIARRNIEAAEKAVDVVQTPAGPMPVGQSFSALAAMLGAGHKNLELYGKGTGLFSDQTAPAGVTVNVLIVAPESSASDPQVSPVFTGAQCQTIDVEPDDSK